MAVIDEDEMVVMSYDETPGAEEQKLKDRGDFVEGSETPPVEVPEPGEAEGEGEAAAAADTPPDDDGGEGSGAGVDGGEGSGETATDADTGSADPDADPNADPDADPGEQVPYGRLAKEVSRRKELEDKLQALEERFNTLSDGRAVQQGQQGQQQEQAKDPLEEKREQLSSKNTEYQEAIIDGDLELATSLYSEIMDINQDLAAHRATTAVQQSSTRAQIEDAANEIVSRNEDYFTDPVNVEIFNGARAAYQQQGLSFTEAMRKAEERLIGSATPPPEDPPPPDTSKQAKDAQRKETVRKNAQAASQQPPRAEGGEGMRRDPPKTTRSILELSEKEFQELPETEKKRLRGDLPPEGA